MVFGFLRGLFSGGGGGGAAAEAPSVEYEGFTIKPAPINDGTSWRVSGEICKEVDGEMKTHMLVRADTFPDRQDAIDTMVANFQGDYNLRRIFAESAVYCMGD